MHFAAGILVVAVALVGLYKSGHDLCVSQLFNFEDCLSNPTCRIDEGDLRFRRACALAYDLREETIAAMDKADMKYYGRTF